MENKSYSILIEISKGTVNNKFEYNHQTKTMVLDFVFENLVWPFNYGEVVGTLGGDGDALDALVFSSEPLAQSSIVDCVPFGIVKQLDRGAVDDKLMFVLVGDNLAEKYKDIEDFSEKERENIKILYAEIARQKKKTIEILGFENKKSAEAEIKKCLIA